MEVSATVRSITRKVMVTQLEQVVTVDMASGLDYNEETIIISPFVSSMTVPREGVPVWSKKHTSGL